MAHAGSFAPAAAPSDPDVRGFGFVSSNCWDACGAKSFGFHTYWINRAGIPLDALDVTPDHTIGGLDELARLLDQSES